MYDEIRQSVWNQNTSKLMNSTKQNQNNCRKNSYSDDDIIDLTLDDDENTDHSNDEFRRHLWCVCKKPWDHSRPMLRCDSCADWFHGDCVGVTKEERKALEVNGDEFFCPSCQELQESDYVTKSSNELLPTKRKYSDDQLITNDLVRDENQTSLKSTSYNETKKRSKTDISIQSTHSLTESKTLCIVKDCNNASKPDWAYCSPACIRHHINDKLQTIQRNKRQDNEAIPTRDDISLYDNKTKTILEKNLVPKIEDLWTWINQHPSYEIIESLTRVSIPLKEDRLLSSVSSTAKTTDLSFKPISTNQLKPAKSILNKKTSPPAPKPIINKMNSPTDLRSKVPSTLYEKIINRLEKSGEKDEYNEKDIRTTVNQIEKEMFRIYGKVDNSYKNKFRSLIANINNMNNNFFYKQILSKDVTAKQIVAMKPEDMLPPEEKEKRRDQFQREIEMIVQAEQLRAEEKARQDKLKRARQGFIDNTAASPMDISNEQSLLQEKNNTNKDNLSINRTPSITQNNLTINESNSKSISSPEVEKKTSLLTVSEDLPSTSLTKTNEPASVNPEQLNPVELTTDVDNDYIEPESPTGPDALIYDEDYDNDEDADDNSEKNLKNPTTSSNDHSEFMITNSAMVRDDYNPSKVQNETQAICQTKPMISLSKTWQGTIHPSDIIISCKSSHIYGENDYLVDNIPEQLIVLGRLRLANLWDFIRNSLAVRDIIILTLIPPSSNTTENESFSKYVDTLDASKRAAVISKTSNSSLIRDMYILPADTTHCPDHVLSSLRLPPQFESKQLFLIVVGSGRKGAKSNNRSNEYQSLNTIVYNPIPLEETTLVRDPRLSKTKDPRLQRNKNENIGTLSTLKLTSTNEPMAVRASNSSLLKLISNSLERIRQTAKADDIHSIVQTTMETLTKNQRQDLCTQFNDRLKTVVNQWQSNHGNSLVITGDNLTEENMDVDDDQDDQNKRQTITSNDSCSHKTVSSNRCRFIGKGLNNSAKTTLEVTSQHKQRRKSRFSDRLPNEDNQSKQMTSNVDDDVIFLKQTFKNSPKTIDRYMNSSLHNKNRSNTNLLESCLPLTNTKDKLISKPIRFSFSKDAFRRHKLNLSSTTISTNNHDIYENSPKFIEDLMRKIQSYGYQGLSLSNENWTKKTLPITPIRSTAMLNIVRQQQKAIHSRFSSNTNEWRSNFSNNNYTTHYHDFDQPQE